MANDNQQPAPKLLSEERLKHIEHMGPHMNSVDRLDIFAHITALTEQVRELEKRVEILQHNARLK